MRNYMFQAAVFLFFCTKRRNSWNPKKGGNTSALFRKSIPRRVIDKEFLNIS